MLNSLLQFLLISVLLFSCNVNRKNDANAQIAATTVADSSKITYPKNIILMIGDGMGVAQISAGMAANRGHLSLERMKYVGLIKTASSDNFVTDSGAGATAFALGCKAKNYCVGMNADGLSQESILERAEAMGLGTGLVATSTITHATPASFIAHNVSRSNYEEIALDYLKTDVDVLIGGGSKHFSDRKDGIDLIDQFKKNGYYVSYGLTDTANVSAKKLVVFTAKDSPGKAAEGRAGELADATDLALSVLKRHDKGFFVMIEGSQIDWGGHAEDLDYITSEMIDFDKAIARALDFADSDGNTLVIVTADHETGGLALTGGDLEEGKVEGKFVYGKHTASMVPVFAYGPGAEAFIGIYANTAIYDKMMAALRLQ